MPARLELWIYAALFALAATLAWSATTTDSVTIDEPAHLVAGYASLRTSDFRLSPDHPPLARWLLALPLALQRLEWRGAETVAWESGDFFTLGREFLGTWNDGERLILWSRAVAVALYLATLWVAGHLARELSSPRAALITVAMLALDPNWLAHGHLATIDVPFTLAALLSLAAGFRWLAEPRWQRWALFALAFSAAALTKFSWPPIVPALAVMTWLQYRRSPERLPVRTLLLGGGAVLLTAWATVWLAYGGRFRATADGDTALHLLVPSDAGRHAPRTPEEGWETVLHDPATGRDRPGVAVPVLRFAHAHRLLPEAYLFGAAFVQKKALGRSAYLNGEFSNEGFRSYFLWTLLVKSPIPILLLSAAAVGALLFRSRSRRLRWHPLAGGLVVFASLYVATLATSGLNLGFRHLLPVSAVLAIAASAVAPATLATARGRAGSIAVALGFSWLLAGTLLSAPHWIGYFNEAVGGWRNGHRFLADSNLDWGQDLLRLRARLRDRPEATPVWLAQAGDPALPHGLAVRRYWGSGALPPDPEPIAGGLYVVSATELLGVYRPLARPAAWRDGRLQARFEEASANRSRTADSSSLDEYEALRRLRLISRLAQREPDERVGTSLFLFRLSDAQVAEWTTP